MNEGKTRGRGFFDAIVPFLTGFALGAMSALASFSGRISALETTTNSHSQSLRDIREDVKAISNKLDQCFESCRK